MIPGLAHLALKRQASQRPPLQGGPLPVTEDVYKRVAVRPGKRVPPILAKSRRDGRRMPERACRPCGAWWFLGGLPPGVDTPGWANSALRAGDLGGDVCKRVSGKFSSGVVKYPQWDTRVT